MRRARGSGSLFYDRNKKAWVSILEWNGKRHSRQTHSRYDAHVALMELRHRRDAETTETT